MASTFFTTLDFPLRPAWTERADALGPQEGPAVLVLWRVVRRARRHRTAVLDGSGRLDQLAAVLLRRTSPRLRIVLTDCTWKPAQRRLPRLGERLLVRLLDGPRTTYCVLSAAERARFPGTWQVDPDRVRVTHWYVGLEDARLRGGGAAEGCGVFAGGDSLRDYRPLLEAAGHLDVPVRIASRRPPPAPVPQHVVYGEAAERDYWDLVAAAAVVAVPLEAGTARSAGQNNYLAPMALGKLVVVTETTGVREYVEHGVTGLVVPPGDAAALGQALRWALDPLHVDERRRIGQRAREHVLARFSPDHYVRRLLTLVDEGETER